MKPDAMGRRIMPSFAEMIEANPERARELMAYCKEAAARITKASGKPLHLYLVERTDGYGYDQNVSAVFAAHSAKEAITMKPGSWWLNNAPGQVTLVCNRIGTAAKGIEKGIVHTHYHHG